MESETGLKVIDKRMQSQPESAVTTSDPSDIVMVAMQKNYDPALIEKMMDLAERNQKNVARQAYFESVANFKAEAPAVKKDKFNRAFNSWYTSLGNLLDTYNPVLGKHGLSISFAPPEQTNETMTVECYLSHRLGHRESVKITAPIDQAAVGKQSGQRSRNAIQDIKSTFTYLRSATCEAILGVAGTEATTDDDGNSAGVKLITEAQAKAIEAKIKEKRVDRNKVLEFFKLDSFDQVPEKNFKSVMDTLKTAKGEPVNCPDKDGNEIKASLCKDCKNRQGCPEWEDWDGNS